MTTYRRSRRPRNARLPAHIPVMEQALGHLLRVHPLHPESAEQWTRNTEALHDGPLFRHWSNDARDQFMSDPRLALTALLRPPRIGGPVTALEQRGNGKWIKPSTEAMLSRRPRLRLRLADRRRGQTVSGSRAARAASSGISAANGR